MSNEAINIKVTDMDTQAKLEALARFLEVSSEDIMPTGNGDFEHGGGDYRVLTDDEADQWVQDRIADDLWAFRPSFIIEHMDTGSLSAKQFEALEKGIELMQNKLCEDATPIVLAMIGGQKRLPEFVSSAIQADGRGHFLSGYDGQEHEQDGFYIYRTN